MNRNACVITFIVQSNNLTNIGDVIKQEILAEDGLWGEKEGEEIKDVKRSCILDVSF